MPLGYSATLCDYYEYELEKCGAEIAIWRRQMQIIFHSTP
jgi:hypothetical protein